MFYFYQSLYRLFTRVDAIFLIHLLTILVEFFLNDATLSAFTIDLDFVFYPKKYFVFITDNDAETKRKCKTTTLSENVLYIYQQC